MAVAVKIDPQAQVEFRRLPLPMQARVRRIFLRLAEGPNVSGAKPLRGDLVGGYRIRSGDFRILFRVEREAIIVWKIGNRKDVYD